MSGPPSGLVPRTNNSSLGLGSVGGARGVGAGVTQVLVNFLLNYQRGNLEQLQKDIKVLQQTAAQANQAQIQAVQKQQGFEKALLDIQNAKFKLAQAGGATSQRALQLQQQAVSEEKKYGQATAFTVQQRALAFQRLTQAHVLTQQDVLLLTNEAGLIRQAVAARGQAAIAARAEVSAQQQLNAAIALEGTLKNQAKAGIGRIGSLGLGLIGGTLGGALVSGVLMEPIQDIIDGLGEMVNPAESAQEAIERLGQSVNELVDSEDISRLEAASRILQEMSTIQPRGPSLDTDQNRRFLELLAINEKVTPQLQAQLDLIKAQKGLVSGISSENREIARQIILQKANLDGLSNPYALHNQILDAITGKLGINLQLQQQIDTLINQTSGDLIGGGAHLDDMASSAADAAAELESAAAAASSLSDELAGIAIADLGAARIDSLKTGLDSFVTAQKNSAEAAINSIRSNADAAADRIRASADSRIDALQKRLRSIDSGPSKRTQRLDERLDNLSDDPSARTKRLQKAIEDLGQAQDKRRYQEQLADIDEEKRLVLLRERLRLTERAINLDDYHGKARLIAIDALLERQRKQNEVQERFNKLLDIQYQISQGVRRQQGETIREFIERRAQYYRGLLQQAAELQREGPQAELEAEKERVQASIDLKELEERRRKLIEDRARQQRLKDLQDQLKASQDRDRRELESRRESLQKQLEASRKADQAATEARREAIQRQIEAVREGAAKQIDAVNNARDREINAREQARDRAIAAAQRVTEMAIAAEERRTEQIKKLSNAAETGRLAQAFDGAQTMGALQWYAGQLSGAYYAMGYLQQSGQFSGLDPQTQARLIGNLVTLTRSFQQNIGRIYRQNRGFAEGGMFMLNNSNTPVGGDIRWGDGQGDEIGVVLSNKVVQTLREQQGMGSGPLVGEMNINTGEDPYRARYQWRREVGEIVDARLAGRGPN